MRKFAKVALLLLPVAIVAGCFNEPTPARETVNPAARVYLQDRDLADLSTVADKFALGVAIDYVNLDRNCLAIFPTELAKLSGLKWLRLNNNQLSQLPDLKELKSLRRLYLRGNRFTAIPEAIRDLPSLTDLEFSENPITTIPDWLAKKEGLKGLSFNRTRLTKLPDDLSAWKSLQQLQLGDLNLSAEEMARIRKALPNVAIVF